VGSPVGLSFGSTEPSDSPAVGTVIRLRFPRLVRERAGQSVIGIEGLFEDGSQLVKVGLKIDRSGSTVSMSPQISPSEDQ
jgi:hypothetical protein